jgi:hypothetical protein
MSTEELKLQIFRQVDSLDASKLKEFYGVMCNFMNSKKDIAVWEGVSALEKEGIENAIIQLNSGEGIAHNEVITKFKNRYKNA